MPFIIYNPDGSVASSGGQAGGGSSSAGAGKGMSPTWIYWCNGGGAAMATSYTNMNTVLTYWNGGTIGTMGAGILMKSPGYVSNLLALVNGQTNGNVYFQLYKNNNPTGLIASGSSASAAFNPSAPGGASYSFAANDLLSIWVKGDNSTTNQSMSANLEWVFTG